MLNKQLDYLSKIVFLFNLGGVETPLSGGFVDLFIDGGLADLANSEIWTTLITILTGAAAAGAIASLYGKSPSDSMLIATMGILILGYIAVDFTSIYATLLKYGNPWMDYIVSGIFIALAFMIIVSFISWWRGAD